MTAVDILLNNLYTVIMIIFKQNKITISITAEQSEIAWLYRNSKIKTTIYRGKDQPPIHTETRLWNGNTSKVSLGLGRYLMGILDKFGEEYVFHEKELMPVLEIDTELPGIDNRDYQIEAVKAVLSNPQGLIYGAVNAGKTEIMSLVCKNYDGTILILVPTDILLKQTYNRLEGYFSGQIGICGSGRLDLSKRIVIGIDKSVLVKLGGHKFDMIMVDECHKHLTPTTRKVLERQPQARVYGFSGTPFRASTSGRKFLDWAISTCLYGKVIAEISTSELIERGISSSGKCFWLESGMYEPKILENKNNESLSNHINYIVNNRQRNLMIGNICVEANKFNLVVCASFKLLEHIDKMKELLLNIYDESHIAVITGKVKSKDREALITGIKQGNYKVVLVSGSFGTGTSINELDVLINCAGGLSNYESVQRFGRILRNNKGRKFTYIDFMDRSIPSILTHSRQRKKDIEKEINCKIKKIKQIEYLSALKSFWKSEF